MVKTIKKIHNDKEYKLTVSTEMGGTAICVRIEELTRPNWKIFRYSWRYKKYRLLHNFESVEAAVKDVMTDYLAEVRLYEEQKEKIKFFEENY